MQTGTDLTKSSIFALLQQGMKDRHAHSIAVLVSLFPELFDVFEQYAKDELESADELEVRECFDAATEILALRAQVKNQQQVIKDCAEVIEMFIDRVEVPDASCSCFISPPCNDCVEHGGLREALQVGKDIYKLIK